VAGTVDPVVIAQVPRRQYGVSFIALVRTGERIAHGNGDCVIEGRAPFSNQQVVAAIVLINMRPFSPNGPLEGASPQKVTLANQFP